MTELETMQRAKMYLDKLARGIDPITDRPVPGDSALNNARLERCFDYVSDVLGRVIANGGTVGAHVRTVEFSITPQQLARVPLSDQPVRITEWIDALWKTVQDPDMKKPNVNRITDWLMAKGLMEKKQGPDGKSHRVPTEQGLQMGMSVRLRQTRDGEYQAVFYDTRMQRLLLDNLGDILK